MFNAFAPVTSIAVSTMWLYFRSSFQLLLLVEKFFMKYEIQRKGEWEDNLLANTGSHVLLIIATSVAGLLLLHLRVSYRL